MPFNNWQYPYMNPQFQQMVRQYLETYHPVAAPPVIPQASPDEGAMINKFRVGCDPEFMLLDATGKTVQAKMYFPHDGEIGHDHNGRVAELRPEPSRGIYAITKKLQTLIKSKPLVDINTRLRAGAICNQDCLGGHIHFGFNAFERKPFMSALEGDGVYNERGYKVVHALDALTAVLEHLDILPSEESKKRRTSGQGQANKYGMYGDVRDCQGHMEYRTMASWLFDPGVTFLCLTAAKLAAADPDAAYQALKDCRSFPAFRNWIETYKGKDVNAARAIEKLLGGGIKNLQIDPTVDFRERWEVLAL